jgi:uncharacterized membrane protein
MRCGWRIGRGRLHLYRWVVAEVADERERFYHSEFWSRLLCQAVNKVALGHQAPHPGDKVGCMRLSLVTVREGKKSRFGAGCQPERAVEE